MATNTLGTIAARMRTYLLTKDAGYAHQQLQRGLHVVLERKGDLWRLAAARMGTPPSDRELIILAKCFGVPLGLPWAAAPGKPAKRGKAPFKVMEVRWQQLPIE